MPGLIPLRRPVLSAARASARSSRTLDRTCSVRAWLGTASTRDVIAAWAVGLSIMVALSAAPMTNYVTYAARVIPPRARRAAARSRSLLLVRLITRIINDLIVVTVPAMRRHSPTRPLDAAGVPENDQRQSGHGCSATSAM